MVSQDSQQHSSDLETRCTAQSAALQEMDAFFAEINQAEKSLLQEMDSARHLMYDLDLCMCNTAF
jgi:hypothetical protein